MFLDQTTLPAVDPNPIHSTRRVPAAAKAALRDQNLITLRNLEALGAADRNQLKQVIHALVGLGFSDYLLVIEEAPSLEPRRQLLTASNPHWIQQYATMQQLCAHTCMMRARQKQGLFQWTDEPRHSRIKGLVSPFQEASGGGLVNGVTLSRHFGRQGIGILLAINAGRNGAGRGQQRMDKLSSLNQQFAEVIDNIALGWGQKSAAIQLTAREYQTLYWAAHGKSSKQAAKLMNLAEVTVRFHFKAVKTKLNTSNRTESVAKALSLGLVQY